MEQSNGKPQRGQGDAVLHRRISFTLERGTDRSIQRRDLEAFQEVGKYTRTRFYDEETKEFWGPAGSAKEAYASIDELDDKAYYIAYGSLDELTGYADFYNWAKDREMDSNLWCAVYTSDEEG